MDIAVLRLIPTRSGKYIYIFPLLLVLMAGWSTPAKAQLTWGVSGTGGSGSWTATTANWWNGTTNQTWTIGDSATFAGTSGTVSLGSYAPVVSAITFNTAGYVIANGSL